MENKYWDPWQELKRMAKKKRRGISRGMVDAHCHLFTERTLTQEHYELAKDLTLRQKHKLIDDLRPQFISTFRERLRDAVRNRHKQGLRACRAYIDLGPSIGLDPIKIAIQEQEFFRKEGFYLQIAVYPIEDMDSDDTRRLLEEACRMREVEVIGCVPGKGKGGPTDHDTSRARIDYFMAMAHLHNKMLDLQVDQDNHPEEKEIELVIHALKGHRSRGYDRPVAATHCLSMAAWHNFNDVLRVLCNMRDLGISLIVCPGAVLNNKQDRNVLVPMHNSIAPWDIALETGVNVAFGADNVSDLYMPSADGDIWKEVKILWDSVRYQGDLSKIADILTINGRKALGLL